MGDRKDWLIRLSRIMAGAFFMPLFRLETEGVEHIPENGPFVLLPKHQRWEDVPIVGLATPRPLYFVAKNELFSNPFNAWFFRSLGGIPLNRQRPIESRQYLNAVVDQLMSGEGVVLFPEGTYFRERMGPGRTGLIRLILTRFSPPFIPIGLRYIRIGLMKTEVRVNFGRRVFSDTEEPVNIFVDRVMKEIARLSGITA
ncbi:Acyltransferase [uncultured Desulfobacterium sp.]|uniref:Acyltransferase n=1 Tax=uncultured Desulfobacterium sp. TaxID=201089 RepID=A0A445MZJ3_9BACT|nr:Acyltransferase [uncultured Desulfobacterium sp.]